MLYVFSIIYRNFQCLFLVMIFTSCGCFTEEWICGAPHVIILEVTKYHPPQHTCQSLSACCSVKEARHKRLHII